MNRIINPLNNQIYNILSYEAKNLLKKYVKLINKNGSGHKPSLVLFYMNGCGWCDKFKPIWEQFKRNHNENFKGCQLIDIENNSHNEQLINKHKIEGFPTLKFCPYGKDILDESVVFEGNREESELKDFIEKNMSLTNKKKRKKNNKSLGKQKG